MGIIITSDSGCDLPQDIQNKYNIKLMPISVILGGEEYLDTINVTPADIFKFVQEKKALPKTAARSVEDFKDFFKPLLDAGNDIVYIGISTGISATTNNAMLAAKELDTNRIFIVDGGSLSSGTGLMLIHAAELIEKGKTASQIAVIETERSKNIQASFVVDVLDYLYKNGRCSALSMFGANMLRIHPSLQLIDGKIVPTEKYRGKMTFILKKYIDDILSKFNNPDTARCFVTHSSADKELVDEIVSYVKSKNIFKEV
ncbi:MAG: DegV family protein [Clostridia bacterium]